MEGLYKPRTNKQWDGDSCRFVVQRAGGERRAALFLPAFMRSGYDCLGFFHIIISSFPTLLSLFE